ncbi:cytoplasmic protein cyt16 [Cystoisospora suis]|uniref:Cytoplasmic protein cyt16 n=1 Tax=Cystoisospora suis TaxID=483139 RepID=A0A2C6JWU7_9APIC|nr:cytoplasmic protein cyt16 [Cystoisospora suis]
MKPVLTSISMAAAQRLRSALLPRSLSPSLYPVPSSPLSFPLRCPSFFSSSCQSTDSSVSRSAVGRFQTGRAGGRRSWKKADGKNSGQGSKYAATGGLGCMVAASPLLFTEYDKTSDPKSELIFMAGNALSYCTEQFFENEYGQSIFMVVLGLVYLAMLGYEGKVHGAVWRMKHVFGTNFRMVGHPRYAYALPKNPLLQDTTTAAGEARAAAKK